MRQVILIKIDIDESKEIDFDDEIKKEAAQIAAYGIIKEMYEKEMINSYELSYIKNKYKVDIE